MTRDVFPRAPDRGIIHAFLSSAHNNLRHDDAALCISNGQLAVTIANTITPVAWYDTAGALWAVLPAITFREYAVLALNHVMTELGHPPGALSREVASPPHPPRYFFQGTPVAIGVPFMLSGPLGIQAYRATKLDE